MTSFPPIHKTKHIEKSTIHMITEVSRDLKLAYFIAILKQFSMARLNLFSARDSLVYAWIIRIEFNVSSVIVAMSDICF